MFERCGGVNMNNTEALNIIYKHLKAGHKFGKWIDNVRYPYFEVNLVMSPDEKYWRWQNYGSSANRANKKELKWVIETIFKMKPVDFLEEYQRGNHYGNYYFRS